MGSSANRTVGSRDERAGDGDALLLAAGELGGRVAAAVAEADARDERVERRRAWACVPAIVSGRRMFSSAVSVGSRLNCWKTKPMCVRRSFVSALSGIAGDVVRRRSWTWPSVGRSSPASRCMSVDLPEPDGPMTAVNWPAGTSMLTPRRASTAASPLPKRRVTAVAATAGARRGAVGDCVVTSWSTGFSWVGVRVSTCAASRAMRPTAMVEGAGGEQGVVASASNRPASPRPVRTRDRRPHLACRVRRRRGRRRRRRRRGRARRGSAPPRRPRGPPRRSRRGGRRAGRSPRARLPRRRRGEPSSSTSKGTGAQRATASGSVSTSSTASGRAATVVVAVHVLMASDCSPPRPRPCRRPGERSALSRRDEPGSSSGMRCGLAPADDEARCERAVTLPGLVGVAEHSSRTRSQRLRARPRRRAARGRVRSSRVASRSLALRSAPRSCPPRWRSSCVGRRVGAAPCRRRAPLAALVLSRSAWSSRWRSWRRASTTSLVAAFFALIFASYSLGANRRRTAAVAAGRRARRGARSRSVAGRRRPTTRLERRRSARRWSSCSPARSWSGASCATARAAQRRAARQARERAERRARARAADGRGRAERDADRRRAARRRRPRAERDGRPGRGGRAAARPSATRRARGRRSPPSRDRPRGADRDPPAARRAAPRGRGARARAAAEPAPRRARWSQRARAAGLAGRAARRRRARARCPPAST